MLLKQIKDNGIDKVINDQGEVAIVHQGMHAGEWYDPLNEKAIQSLFDPKIVDYILTKQNKEDVLSYIKDEYKLPYFEHEDIETLVITWVKAGRKFVIYEYDGIDVIEYLDKPNFVITA